MPNFVREPKPSKAMTAAYQKVHPLFKLNGFHLDRDDLCRVAYSFIKEGDPYEQAIGSFILDWFDAKPYLEVSTSGTTGAPKLIQVQKSAMVQSALATGAYFDLSPGNKALHCLPTQYIAGKMMLVRSFILGLDLDLVAPNSTPLAKNTTTYHFVAMVPLQVQNSIDSLGKVKKLIVGGAKMNQELESLVAKLPTQIFETYGMTETVSHIAAKRVGTTPFSILPNVTISQDQRGCLVINAPLVSSEVLITNDLVEIINEKEFILLGRADNIINSGGIKLIPEQIETKLASKIKERFFVAGISDATLGEKLVLVIEGEAREISLNVFETLSTYEKPKDYFFVPQFLETESGKIKRKEIITQILHNTTA
jgi:O-succinylbenzoic acid--CoA ligase